MLRSNLSTRPFYNERLVSLLILLALVLALALTAFNVVQIATLSRRRGEFVGQIDRDNAEAQRIRTAAGALQKSIDQQTLRRLGASTREANSLIDQRTFSWTAFFETVEKTLPLDARLIAVSPRVEKGEFLISMIVVAKSPDELKQFTEALQNTGQFYDVGPTAQQRNDDGTFTATIQAGYLAAVSPGRKGRP